MSTIKKDFLEINEKELNSGNENKSYIFEGENLYALDFLIKYKEKVDLIYIDPPYNTKNSNLTYKDNLLRSEWISFMEERLKKAKILMAEKSAIFISIDEYQQSHLKILCDEIFGENNCLGTFIRKTKTITGDSSSGINTQHEFLLAYSKNKKNIVLRGAKKSFEKFSNPDNDPNGDWTLADPSAKSGGETTYFPITNPITGQVDYPPKGRYWAFSRKTMEEYIKSGRIKFKNEIKKNQRGFIFKRYSSAMKSQYMPFGTLDFATNDYLNSVATKELRELLPDNDFSYPKPLNFIKTIIKSFPGNDITVLDFFAGSGTTGHAVMELNMEDNGNRKFILCNSNENNICENTTYERIKKVAEKLKIKTNIKYLKQKGD